jgi:8-amino-7-oxononanoate synthase
VSALVFSSGYLANLGVLTMLGGPDVTIVSDAGNHASIIDACRLSGAQVVVTPHRDTGKLDAALATAGTPHAVVVTDAVFSVDGDLAPLREIHEISQQHRAPSVPPGRSCLRLTARADLTATDLDRVADVLGQVLGSRGRA